MTVLDSDGPLKNWLRDFCFFLSWQTRQIPNKMQKVKKVYISSNVPFNVQKYWLTVQHLKYNFMNEEGIVRKTNRLEEQGRAFGIINRL